MSVRLAATSAVCVTKSTTHDVNSIPWKYQNGDSALPPNMGLVSLAAKPEILASRTRLLYEPIIALVRAGS